MAWNQTDDKSYVIEEEIAVLSESKTGWRKELNKISWNGQPAKYDIRDWAENRSRMGKGVTLSESEMKELLKVMDQRSWM